MKINVRNFALVALAAACLAVGGSGRATEVLTTLPFDEALSVYVAHDGTWLNYASGQDEAAEIEDPLVAFGPEETPDDEDFDDWKAHEINSAQAPAGWFWYEPTEGEPMQLKVAIEDTAGRLDSVEVKDWDTGQVVGTLAANQGGTEVRGSLNVNPAADALRIRVLDASENLLVQAAAVSPVPDDLFIEDVTLGWLPNCGAPHTPCDVTGRAAPFGDPAETPGDGIRPDPQECASCWGASFDRDVGEAGQLNPLYAYSQKRVVKGSGVVAPDDVTLNQRNAIRDIIDAAKAHYPGGLPLAVSNYYTAPPYSHGHTHYPVNVRGEVHAIFYAVYRGISGHKVVAGGRFQGDLQTAKNGVVGGGDATAALMATLTIMGTEKKVGGPIKGAGDIWGLICNQGGAPTANPLANCTAPVTFTLSSNPANPDPNWVLRGSGTATRGAKFTPGEIAPPTAGSTSPATLDMAEGTCAVDLGKGWNWTATVQHNSAYHGAATPSPDQFEVSGGTDRHYVAPLTKLVCLDIFTSEPAWIEIDAKVDGQWSKATEGWTTYLGEEPDPIWFGWNGNQNEGLIGQYRIRALSWMGGDWVTDEFTATPQWGMMRYVDVSVIEE